MDCFRLSFPGQALLQKLSLSNILTSAVCAALDDTSFSQQNRHILRNCLPIHDGTYTHAAFTIPVLPIDNFRPSILALPAVPFLTNQSHRQQQLQLRESIEISSLARQ